MSIKKTDDGSRFVIRSSHNTLLFAEPDNINDKLIFGMALDFIRVLYKEIRAGGFVTKTILDPRTYDLSISIHFQNDDALMEEFINIIEMCFRRAYVN